MVKWLRCLLSSWRKPQQPRDRRPAPLPLVLEVQEALRRQDLDPEAFERLRRQPEWEEVLLLLRLLYADRVEAVLDVDCKNRTEVAAEARMLAHLIAAMPKEEMDVRAS